MIKFKWSTFIMLILNFVVSIFIIALAIPSEAPVFIDGHSIVQKMGSPWILILPFVLTPFLFNLFSLLAKDKSTDERSLSNNRTRDIVVSLIGFLFVYIAWLLLLIDSSGAKLGQTIQLEPMLLIIIPIAYIIYTIFSYIPYLNEMQKGISFGLLPMETREWKLLQKINFFVGVISAGLIYIFAIIANFIDVMWLGYFMMGIIISLAGISMVLTEFFLYKNYISKKDFQEQIKKLSENIDTLETVIDTQETLKEEIDKKVKEPKLDDESPVNDLTTKQVVNVDDSDTIKDTADYIDEKKKKSKKSN